jgi:nucleotide-binding universal stress UspA family protein
MPLTTGADMPASVAQTVIFESGRPAIILQSGTAKAKLDTIVVAWDGSRPAARAVADAMPVLSLANTVQILTVVNEKESAVSGSGVDLTRHLKVHGIEARMEEVDAGGAAIGAVLEQCVRRLSADLLVMGAYGHSRVREFLLGGATQSVLRAPPVPVFLSH